MFTNRNRHGRLLGSLALLASLTLAASACSAGGGTEGSGEGGETFTFTFASSGPPGQGITDQMEWYMDEVAARSDGRISWEKHWAGSLLPSAETLAGVEDGRADASFFASSYDPGRFPLFHVGYVPRDGINAYGSALAWNELSSENELLQEEFADAGVVPLIFVGVSNAATISGPNLFTTIDDLDGLRIRFAGPITEAIDSFTGADPVTMFAEDLYSGMETGAIDAIGGYSIDALAGAGLGEVAPIVHSLDESLGYYSSSIGLIFNKELWESLPDDIRQLMIDVREDYYAMLPDQMETVESAACDTLIGLGGGMVQFPADPAEGKAWVAEVGTSLVDTWTEAAVGSGHDAAEVGDFAETFWEAAERFSEESSYVPGAQACIARTDLGN